MQYIQRVIEKVVRSSLKRHKSVLLFGARQTGKTTLTERLNADLCITFIRPEIRQQYEKNSHLFTGEVEALGESSNKGKRPLVILDEVQKVPDILDTVQDLIDRRVADFVITGSSARKLKHRSGMNLLPGRVTVLHLDPFSLSEFPDGGIEDRLIYGSLPGIITVRKKQDREIDLESYVTTYLEEEIRAEATVRNLGDFARFLELAASESGNIMNLRKLSQEVGVAHTTIGAYYQILEDCLIAERVEPLSKSGTRKKLTKSAKFLFFDLGVRRVAAREGTRLPRETMGKLFEQWVGLELIRAARTARPSARIRFWRDPDGPEVDWVIEKERRYIPIEVKWTEHPTADHCRHLEVFLSEYPTGGTGYVICRVPRKVKLSKRVYALPWQETYGLV